MRIAVVGAGVAGLSLCYYLLEKGYEVTLFEKTAIGRGASGIAAGLLHPYVGQKGLRSHFATQALVEARKLLKIAEAYSDLPIANYKGIYRLHWDKPPLEYGDIHVFPSINVGFGITASPCYLIESGVTVFMDRYLDALFRYLKMRGLDFIVNECTSLDPINRFDHTIFTIGEGLRRFPIHHKIPIQFVKGQIISCRVPAFMEEGEKSVIGKGHISITKEPSIIQLGSTYEHHYKDKRPDLRVAKDYIEPRIKTFFARFDELEILSCYAEVRVCLKGGYLPIIERLTDRTWLLTGMGSRGLLYSGLYGRKLSNLIG
jgi:glycine/D-amino acid oxidase-like deaminating enzyme